MGRFLNRSPPPSPNTSLRPQTLHGGHPLSAMENAGKEDMPDEAERKDLGTPATRAAIIEKLVSGGFVECKGKNLIPTKAGVNLVTVLPELLTSPKLTADWEQRLNEVAKGQASPEDFMDGSRRWRRSWCGNTPHFRGWAKAVPAGEGDGGPLPPRCGKPVYEGKKKTSPVRTGPVSLSCRRMTAFSSSVGRHLLLKSPPLCSKMERQRSRGCDPAYRETL